MFKMRLIIILTLLLIISSCAISKKQNEDNIKKELLKGRWELLQPKSNLNAFSGSNNIYIFEDSLFKNNNYWFSDVGPIDSCGERSRFIYSKGNYIIEDSILYLKGVYTDKTFEKENTNACSLMGEYKREFDFYIVKDTLVLRYKPKPKLNIKVTVKLIKK